MADMIKDFHIVKIADLAQVSGLPQIGPEERKAQFAINAAIHARRASD